MSMLENLLLQIIEFLAAKYGAVVWKDIKDAIAKHRAAQAASQNPPK